MRGGGYLAEEAQPAPQGYPYRWERSGTQEEPGGPAVQAVPDGGQNSRHRSGRDGG